MGAQNGPGGTRVRDNFNRPDGSVGPNYQAGDSFSLPNIVGGRLIPVPGTEVFATGFPPLIPPCEVFVTYGAAAKPGVDTEIALWQAPQPSLGHPGNPYNPANYRGYTLFLSWRGDNPDNIAIYKGPDYTQMDYVPWTYQTGDSYALSFDGYTARAYVYRGGVWTQVLSAPDEGPNYGDGRPPWTGPFTPYLFSNAIPSGYYEDLGFGKLLGNTQKPQVTPPTGPNATPILDDFNRQDSAPFGNDLGPKWGGTPSMTVVNRHAFTAGGPGPELGNWWAAGVQSPCEAWYEIAFDGAIGRVDYNDVELLLVNSLSTFSGYALTTGGAKIFLDKAIDYTPIDPALPDFVPYVLQSGERLGLTYNKPYVTAWAYRAGVWTALLTIEDPSPQDNGIFYPAMYSKAENTRVPYFGGGHIVKLAATPDVPLAGTYPGATTYPLANYPGRGTNISGSIIVPRTLGENTA